MSSETPPVARIGRSMEETPTWAVAVVCFVIVLISITIEHILHLVGKWLAKKHKRALHEALEKVKAELMVMGFISLLLTIGQSWISEICIPQSVGDTWHPCNREQGQSTYSYGYPDRCTLKGDVALISTSGIHQLHIFIFVLAITHVLYCIITLALGRLKMRKWKSWEKETKTVEYQFTHDPERFRFARDTSFGRRHLNFWSETPILIWIVCFFRQFFRSVPKVDYLTLRHGFIVAHLAPQSSYKFDFQKYINRSLEEDFIVVVGISPTTWLFAVVFLLFNTYGWYSYFWFPFVPLIIILLVGTKLQVIITRMGLRIQDRGDVIKGTPTVEPADDLFWFNSPRLILYLINFVLFQNAFQLAFFAWSWYEFGLRSCFHRKWEDVIIRISMGVLIQLLCSYVTLPLYALVTQMGSTMKPTIFNDRVATALKNWHHTARKQIKRNHASGSVTPMSSRPATPSYGMSPIHLLRNNIHRSEQYDSFQTSPTKSIADNDNWESDGSPSPVHPQADGSSSHHRNRREIGEQEQHAIEMSLTQLVPPLPPIHTQHEIDIDDSKDQPRMNKVGSVNFSFDKRQTRK